MIWNRRGVVFELAWNGLVEYEWPKKIIDAANILMCWELAPSYRVVCCVHVETVEQLLAMLDASGCNDITIKKNDHHGDRMVLKLNTAWNPEDRANNGWAAESGIRL